MDAMDVDGNVEQTAVFGRDTVRPSDLARLFPAVLGRGVWKPLKIGIVDDILGALGPQVNKASVNKCLRIHTSLPGYLKALAAGGSRFNLDGAPCGEVNEESQAFASKTLETIKLERKAVRQRGLFLKAFEATRLSVVAYAAREGLDERKVHSDIDRARHERRLRHEKEATLVKKFEDSHMSVESFAHKQHIPLKELQVLVAKVAARRAAEVRKVKIEC